MANFDPKQVAEALDRERRQWLSSWRNIANWFLPREPSWLAKPGKHSAAVTNNRILNPTGSKAAASYANGFTEGTISRTREWFKLRLPGFDYDGQSEVGAWLAETERRMRLVLAQSNFYQALGQAYFNMGLFGSGAVYIEPDSRKIIRCYNSPIGEFAFGVDASGQVDKVHRVFALPASALRARFSRVPERLSRAAETERFVIHHLTTREKEYYWLDDGGKDEFLETKPVSSWPWATPRYDVLGYDNYGTGIGFMALRFVKALQHMELQKARLMDKWENPPLQADAMLQNNAQSMIAGGVTFVPGLLTNPGAGVRPLYQVDPRLQEIIADIQRLETTINSLFFVDLFLMMSQLDTVRSATEIIERKGEKMVMLGPVLQRVEDEVLSPAIARVYDIMETAGLVPEPPSGVAGAELTVEYVSMLYQAQQATGTVAIERWLALTGNTAGVWQEAPDRVDIDNTLADYAEKLGVSPANVRSDEDLEALRARRAEQASLEQAQQLAAGAKTLSETQVGGGQNALEMMLGG